MAHEATRAGSFDGQAAQSLHELLYAELAFFEPATVLRVALRLGAALLLGAIIGWDRERRDADAGLRTHMLVALGAALFIVVPLEAGMNHDALSRVVQGLVSGIGFIGAGTVLKNADEGRVHGLTTAGSIWVTAALGLAAGLGQVGIALFGALLVLVVLTLLRHLCNRP